jgi:hypothetical protein
VIAFPFLSCWQEPRLAGRGKAHTAMGAATLGARVDCTRSAMRPIASVVRFSMMERMNPGSIVRSRNRESALLPVLPIVRQKDEQTHGCYRTEDRILEIYDAMLISQRTDRPYQTRLDPPPGTAK